MCELPHTGRIIFNSRAFVEFTLFFAHCVMILQPLLRLAVDLWDFDLFADSAKVNKKLQHFSKLNENINLKYFIDVLIVVTVRTDQDSRRVFCCRSTFCVLSGKLSKTGQYIIVGMNMSNETCGIDSGFTATSWIMACIATYCGENKARILTVTAAPKTTKVAWVSLVSLNRPVSLQAARQWSPRYSRKPSRRSWSRTDWEDTMLIITAAGRRQSSSSLLLSQRYNLRLTFLLQQSSQFEQTKRNEPKTVDYHPPAYNKFVFRLYSARAYAGIRQEKFQGPACRTLRWKCGLMCAGTRWFRLIGSTDFGELAFLFAGLSRIDMLTSQTKKAIDDFQISYDYQPGHATWNFIDWSELEAREAH